MIRISYRLEMSRISSIRQGRPAKWTGMRALVLEVTISSIFSGEMFMEGRSMSAKTGFAPTWVMALAVAAKVIGVVITSSSGRSPETIMERWMPAVQEWSATAWPHPM